MVGTDDAGDVPALARAIGAQPGFPPAFGLCGEVSAGDGLGLLGSHLVQGWLPLQCGWRGLESLQRVPALSDKPFPELGPARATGSWCCPTKGTHCSSSLEAGDKTQKVDVCPFSSPELLIFTGGFSPAGSAWALLHHPHDAVPAGFWGAGGCRLAGQHWSRWGEGAGPTLGSSQEICKGKSNLSVPEKS